MVVVCVGNREREIDEAERIEEACSHVSSYRISNPTQKLHPHDLITSQQLPPSNTIPLGAAVSTYKFCEDTNMQSIVLIF